MHVQCCPVCEGRGNVPAGFYNRSTLLSNTAPEECRACWGRGYLLLNDLIGVRPDTELKPCPPVTVTGSVHVYAPVPPEGGWPSLIMADRGRMT